MHKKYIIINNNYVSVRNGNAIKLKGVSITGFKLTETVGVADVKWKKKGE